MGCGCGGGNRPRTINKTIGVSGVRSQTIAKPFMSKPRTIVPLRTPLRRTCPKCGWIMSSSVIRYDPITKRATQQFICTNRKKCNYIAEK